MDQIFVALSEYIILKKIMTKVEKIQKDFPGLDPITFTFSENSNHWRETLLAAIRQNIAG